MWYKYIFSFLCLIINFNLFCDNSIFVDKSFVDLISDVNSKNKVEKNLLNRKDFFLIVYDDFDLSDLKTFVFQDCFIKKDVKSFLEISNEIHDGKNKYDTKITFSYDGDIPKIINLNNYTLVVFKVELTDKSTKYICCNDCNSIDNEGIFSYVDKIKSITIEHIYKTDSSKKWDNCENLFKGCKNLEEVDFKDHDYDFINIDCMFCDCINLTCIRNIISIFAKSQNIKNCKSLFIGCIKLQFENIGFVGILLPKIFNIFERSPFKTIDLSSCIFSNVESISFSFCENLIEIHLNITSETNNLKDLKNMFYECKSLLILDLSKINVNNVTDFESAFYNCTSLKEINLTGWKFKEDSLKVNLFVSCINLEKIIGLEDIKFSKQDNTGKDYSIFDGFVNLKILDLSTFIFEDCENTFISNCSINTLILPKDRKSAAIFINKCLNNTNSRNKIIFIKYKDYTITDIIEDDDLVSFINNPVKYINNRASIQMEVRLYKEKKKKEEEEKKEKEENNFKDINNKSSENNKCCRCFFICCIRFKKK